jgi:dTDP-glucose 4,6-dehydratase
MADILVTGGRGFIGTNLVRELRSRDHDVWTTDILHGDDARHLRADAGSFRQMDTVLRRHRFHLVYHLAAEYGRWNGEDHYENLWRTNIVGTKHLLRLQEQHRFRLVFFSSAEVYGDYGGVMAEEVMDRVPIRQMNDYALTKWAGELQCLNHATMTGVEIVRVRPVGCYGPYEHYSRYRGVIPVFVYHALMGLPFTVHCGHRRIFDYVDDTCRTLANIVDRFLPGRVYNLGGRQEWALSIEDLAGLVLEATGASPGLARFEAEEAFTTRIKLVDSSLAQRELGHDPQVDIREGLARYVAWARRAYGLCA